MQTRKLLAGLLLALTALSAMAYERMFPPNTKLGTVSLENYPTVAINGTARSVSAALRIWNTNNLIQVPASLTGSKFLGKYTESLTGDVDRIWILTEEEAQKALANASSSSSSTSSTSTSTTTTTTTTTTSTTGTTQ
ncbi:MAG: hypothetical protein H6R04_224 [Burkholderiaceae bacterium]|nr:hypothetical protein [Burkholderiaceae bacterium]